MSRGLPEPPPPHAVWGETEVPEAPRAARPLGLFSPRNREARGLPIPSVGAQSAQKRKSGGDSAFMI